MTNKKVDFNEYAKTYDEKIKESNLSFIDNHEYFCDFKADFCRRNISDESINILEFGCGIGKNIPYLLKYFPNSTISGYDISEESLEVAKKNNPDVCFFSVIEDSHLEKFDFIFVAGVFHHIKPNNRIPAMKKLSSFLRQGGYVYIFEHNPYNPITRRIVNACEFDADAILLKPFELKELFLISNFHMSVIKYIHFFPALLKRIRWIEKYMTKIPLGGQYVISAHKL